MSLPDSTILEYAISEDEDISYEISVNKKQYEALFYQKTADYDSLSLELDIMKKSLDDITDTEEMNIYIEKISMLMERYLDATFNSINNKVWFCISERYGKYYITIFYDNMYNMANGEDL